VKGNGRRRAKTRVAGRRPMPTAPTRGTHQLWGELCAGLWRRPDERPVDPALAASGLARVDQVRVVLDVLEHTRRVAHRRVVFHLDGGARWLRERHAETAEKWPTRRALKNSVSPAPKDGGYEH